ncbi:hypothetical protein HPO96_31125 [Kribbella sandramycini]|uniref:Uncharacterized protein n=1 Tax=Kribbella sandramycini TaxID=60450 RepID=A0A7Y4L7F4_9ACTN|nr:hypothetical protein [Kribbella sandramycini]MBB6566989.1 hypothetical protein [Kribbella sandramycini]NOL44711.1 hypothetical protein [Kribbella sandramycini]
MRYRSLTAALAVLAAGVLTGQAPATAAPQALPKCSLPVPAKLTINSPSSYIYSLKLGSGCPKTVQDTNWWAVRPDGRYNYGVGGPWDSVTIWVNKTPIGVTTRWTPDGYGRDSAGRNVATLLPATSTTKCAAAIGLTGVRKGTKTTLSARATYYATKTNAFARHHGRVLFQKRDVGSTTWTDLGWAYPNSKTGAASFVITTNRARDYRVYVPSSQTVWYAYSATKRV